MNLKNAHRKIGADALVRSKAKEITKEIDRLYTNQYREVVMPNCIVNVFCGACLVLHDKFGWGHKRLDDFIRMTTSEFSALFNEYGEKSFDEAMQILKDECDIDLISVKQWIQEGGGLDDRQ